MDGSVFLWAVLFTVIGFVFFMRTRNVIVKILFLVIGIGGLYAALVYWTFVSGTVALSIAAIAIIAAGSSMLQKKNERASFEVPVAIVLLIIGIFGFLATIGALQSDSGFLRQLKEVFDTGGEVFSELLNRTKDGVEELNQ